MIRLRALWLVACAAGGAVLGWAGLRLFVMAGRQAPVLDYTALYSLGAVSAVVLYLGIRVKLSATGKSHFDPIAAARTLVLAQASGYAGAVITGWHVPSIIALASASGASASFSRGIVLAVAGIVMVVIGYIVQHLCKLPPEEPDDSNESVATE